MTDGYRGAGRRGAGLSALCIALCFALSTCTATLSAGRRDVVDQTPDDNFNGFLESESLLPVPRGPPARPLPQSPGRQVEQAMSVEQPGPTGQLQPTDPPRRTTGTSINRTSPAQPTDDLKENQEAPVDSNVHDSQLKFTPDNVLSRGPRGPQGPPSRYSAEANLGNAAHSQPSRNVQDQQKADTTRDTVIFSPFQEEPAESQEDEVDLDDLELFPAGALSRTRRQADNEVYQSGDNCDSSTCPTNEYCATLSQGKFCVCSPGYRRPLGNAGDCRDVDECALNTHTCAASQTCRNTVGSFVCECPNGGLPGSLSSCVGLYPYGFSQGDSSVGFYDDSTASVYLDVGFPVGRSRYNWIYIGTNGIISFGYPYNSPIPYIYDNLYYYNNYYSYSYGYYNNYYMTSSFYNNYYYNYHFSNFYSNYYFYPWNYINRPRIIAPFWTDISLRYGRGHVFYHVYRAGCATDAVTNYVLLRANSDMAAYMRRRNFRSRVVVVATWEDVEPYSDANYYDPSWWWWWNGLYSQYYSSGREQITFQSVLISDGQESFVLFFYKQGRFGWRYKFGRRIVIGSVGVNDQFSTVYHSYSSSAFIMDQLVGNTGERGFWAFQVGNHYSSAQACMDWYNCNKNDRTIRSMARLLPDCPCAPERLAWDRRWGRAFNRNSYVCYTLRPQFWLFPLGKECCYRNGIFETRRPNAGSVFRYDPWYDWRLHQTMDVQAKDNCCSRSSLCHLYYELRPTGSCSFVSFWQESALFGDPHILTLDSKSYTFNGWGEYTLVNVDTGNQTFVLQGRTSQAMTENGTTSNATVFTAFAAKDSQNATMHVELNLNKTGMVIYGNGIDQTISFYADELFEYVSSNLVLSRENQSLVVAFSASGASLKVTVGVNLLTVTVTTPNAWKNMTRGLMGNFNGNPEDDFVAKNGSALPGSATEEDIFTYFGSTWEITQAESVLMYPPGKSHSDYQNPSFQPIFLDKVDQAKLNRSYEVCGGRENLACVYDYVATGSVNIATASATTLKQTMAAQTELQKVFPSLEALTETLYVNVSETVTGQLNGSDPDTGSVTYYVADNRTDVIVNNKTGMFTYTPRTSSDLDSLSFYVADKDGLKSPIVVVDVVICSGCSGHGTCNFTDTSRTEGNNASNSNTRLAVCTCDIGWTGADCETDVDACAGNPCAQGQNCTDLDPATHKAQAEADLSRSPEEFGFNCSACPEGFEASLGKCLDIDECNRTKPCQQRCENTEGSYRCSCDQGYRLVNGTCIDIDECLERVSDCQQVCTNTPGSFNCSCEDGYQLQQDGKTCNLTDAARCATLQCDHGCRRNNTGSLVCFCFQGYQLVNDSKCVNLNECNLTPRPCAQQCEDLTPGFRCSCFPGHILSPVDGSTCLPCGDNQYGVNCSQTCECGDQSLTCHPVQGCVCPSQWTGPNCTEDVNECEVNPNLCNKTDQICVNTPGSYECQCLSGYTMSGDTCTNVNECSDVALNNCSSNQVCRDIEGSYACDCTTGFAGPNCDDIDECQSLQSGCSQLCDNMEGSFNCRCHEGYVLADDRKTCNPPEGVVDPCAAIGNSCSQSCYVDSGSNTSRCFCDPGFRLGSDNATCTDINECVEANNTCSHNCTNTNGSYTCSCPVGFALDKDRRTCRECDDTFWGASCKMRCDCGVGGRICHKDVGCECKAGFNNTRGSPCVDVNECDRGTHNCSANATCQNTPGSFRCLCASGFTLNATNNKCEDTNECLSSPCDQGCINTVGSFHCNCSGGFTVNGTTCQDINECEVNNGGCQHECRNNLGSFTCGCRAGYEVDPNNRLACMDVDECKGATHTCGTSENCNNTDGGFVCFCKAGYRKNATEQCVDIDDCQESTHNCSVLETCNNTAGGFTCLCKAGYRKDAQGQCTDIDECQESAHNCSALETCNNTAGGFTCLCKAGYRRNAQDQCTDIDECSDNNGGCAQNCINNVGSFQCSCRSGYTASGANCADINECATSGSNCTVVEDCVNTVGGFNCTCKAGYERGAGSVCTDVNECLSNPCPVRKDCTNTDASFVCTCKNEYRTAANGSCIDTKNYSLQLILDLPFENTANFTQRIIDLIKQHYENSIGVDGAVEVFDTPEIKASTSGSGTMVNLTLNVNRDTVPQTDASVAKATAAARTQGLKGDSETVPVSSLQLQGQEVAVAATSCQVFEQLSPCNPSTTCDDSGGLPSCKPLASAQQDLPLIIGLAVGLSLALLALIGACAIYAWCRNRQRRRAERAALGRGNIYGSVRQAFGSSIPTRHYGKSRLLYEPDTMSSASSAPVRGKSMARPDFQDSPYLEPERPARPDTENQPSSNFSWDFLYRALQPDGEFKIERPQFTAQPNQIFNGRGQFPDSTA